MEIAIALAVIAVIFITRTIKIVPQQTALIVERLGKYDRTLVPGLKFVIPFIERVAYRHSLKEVPLDVPSQVCITKDNTQLQVDGILFFQITDPMRASYGSSDYLTAITQLAQTTLRSVIGKMELDRTFEERDLINASVVSALDEAALTSDLRLRYATQHSLRVNSTAEVIETVQKEARTGQLFLVVLTALTSVLAVFGVFAVIYVSIYGRRAEIGMLKAIGSPGAHLTKVFVGEALVMTLSATLTGVTAGVILAFVLRYSQSFQQEVPTMLAFDPVVVPLMLGFMILSSLTSAIVATHSYRRRKAIEIMRTV